MSKRVEIGEQWFIVSMKWIKKWQDHVGFEAESTNADDENESAAAPQLGPNPGKIDNRDIIVNGGEKLELEE